MSMRIFTAARHSNDPAKYYGGLWSSNFYPALRELGCEIPVIVLSGWPEELYGQPEERMVTRILIKPIMTPVLLNVIKELVD